MPNCGRNTLIVARNTTASGTTCGTGCSNVGPTDCINVSLSPRRNRGKVIDQIKEYVMIMLGAPTVDLELDEQALDLVVKQTLKIMEYFAPSEYFQYYNFLTTSGKSVYKMPDDVGYVRHVAYRETGSDFTFQSADLQGAIPIEYFYPGGAYASIQGGLIDPIQPIWGRAGEWALYKMYERMYSRMSSSIGGWEFLGGYRYVKIYPVPLRPFHVVVHYMQRCFDWEEVTLAMQEGALIHAKMILGQIRKKYASLPGPSQGMQLDGESMYQEAKQDYAQWKQDLLNIWGEPLAITMG